MGKAINIAGALIFRWCGTLMLLGCLSGWANVWRKGKPGALTFSLEHFQDRFETQAMVFIIVGLIAGHAVRYLEHFVDANDKEIYKPEYDNHMMYISFWSFIGMTFMLTLWGLFATKSPDCNFTLPFLTWGITFASLCLSHTNYGFIHVNAMNRQRFSSRTRNMNPITNTKADIKSNLIQMSVWVFGYLGTLAVFYSAGLVTKAWMQYKREGIEPTFQLLGPFSLEGGICLFWICALLGLHAIRYYIASQEADEDYFLKEQPAAVSKIMNLLSLAVICVFGIMYFVWGVATSNSVPSNYVLPFLLVLASASFIMCRYGYIHPFSLNEEAKAKIEQEHAPEINPYNPNNDPPPAPKVANRKVPRKTFKDVFGNTEIKARLRQAAQTVISERKPGAEPRNGILLDGEAGNGKSMMAEAMAGELGLPFYTLTHSDVASQWVGKRTEQVRAAFDEVIQNQPCVFFIDEVDSFLAARNSGGNDSKEDLDVVNSLLTLLVDIRQHRVVVMAATNYADNLDSAAIREGRFDFKVEITPPDEEARLGLLNYGLTQHVPLVRSSAETIKSLAQRLNSYSVKRILAITEELPSYIADQQKAGRVVDTLEYADFMAALRRIQGRAGARPENVKPLSELVLPEATKEALEMLAGRMLDPMRVERLGGTVPTGVLFYGPPGTGKTVACKAFAKKVDVGFLIATGPDLARDPKALEKLYNKAKDLRPCIIFIDEADDLVRSREYSNNTEATNKLLTLMDGVKDRVKDVVWVAATNHYDQIDSALLRGGRFTEKVEFVRPDAEQLEAHIEKWLAARNVRLAQGVTPLGITKMLGDQSIANADAVLQSAVNRAISMTDLDDVCVSALDVERAVITVLGAPA